MDGTIERTAGEDTVMAVNVEEPEVVIPGDAAQYKGQREQLAEIPLLPVTQVDVESVMEEVETRENGENDGGMEDLFGDDDEEDGVEREQQALATLPADSEEKSPQIPSFKMASVEPDLSDAELERRRRLEYEEGDEQEPVIEQKVQYAQIKLAKLPMASAEHKLWHAKLPNFLHLESRPYTESEYDPSNEPSPVPPENVIRWRWHPHSPTSKKQSNARFVRWSDGSLSLQIGSELFDVITDRSVSGKSLAPSNPTPFVSGSMVQSLSDSTTYLIAQHPYAGLLESQALVGGTMTFRPTAIQSTSHRKLAASNKQGAPKANKVVMMMASADPEAEKHARELAAKGSRRPRAARGEGGVVGGKKSKRKNVRSTRLDDFSDGEEGSGSDADEDGEFRALAIARKKQRAKEQEEMEDFLASESESEEEGDENDEAGAENTKGGGRRGRARKNAAERLEMQEEDDLDAMEARAERAARAERMKKKEAKTATTGTSGSAIARQQREASVNSEDLDAEDTEFTKKKLVVESDEEE